MTDFRLRFRRQLRAEPESFFSVLYSFAGLSAGAVATLGAALVLLVGVAEQTTSFPLPADLVLVLIVAGVTFHGSSAAGIVLAIAAGAFRFAAVVAPPAGANESMSTAAIEAAVLLALLLGISVVAQALHRTIGTLQRQAFFDSLTGTFNKRGFLEAAERERLRSHRIGESMTVAYFDVDSLKEMNDVFGHQAGDDLIVRFASTVASSVRPYDIFGRVGGDEFVLVLSGVGQREALHRISGICARLAEEPDSIAVSVGMVTHEPPVESLGDLLQEADRLMYRAKRSGGNHIVGAVRSPRRDRVPQVVDLAALQEEGELDPAEASGGEV
jgi:diguanylate cyclase (GGDEF)-like protein